MAAGNTRASAFSRRDFLSAAALGAATYVAAGPTASFASASDGLISTANIDAFEGVLRGFAQGTFEIDTGYGVRQVVALASSTFWKGGETSWNSFALGDSVLVRTVDGQLDRAWANLTRLRGQVVSGGSSGNLTVALDDSGNEKVVVAAPNTASFVDSFTATVGRVSLPPTTGIDVIGLQTPTGLVASVIGYGLPGATPVQSPQPSPTITQAVAAAPDVLMCTYTYNHFASWFTCGTGLGRCGTCNTSNSSQCAWPSQETCGCCTSSCCDCDHGCVTLAVAGCGHHVQVTDACSSKYRDTVIADCGPCLSTCGCSGTSVCGHTCSLCGKSRTHPVVDLTKPTFAVFRDPASFGCFPAAVSVTIPC
jgi:hypothetical protein